MQGWAASDTLPRLLMLVYTFYYLHLRPAIDHYGRDLSGTLVGTAAGITVNAAAFNRYQLSVPNGADSKGHILVTAGETISLTVRATDAFGNTIAGYRGKAKFSSTDTLAGLPAAYSFTAADAGSHTFAVDLKTATPNGVIYSFSVVDASSATTLAMITGFEVINAAAAKFTVAVPSNITAGTPFSLRVSVSDAYGNRVKNYFGTVHFANTAGIAGLPADYAFTGTDAGDHSFTVILSTTGSQTLKVTDLLEATLTSSVTVNVTAVKSSGGGGGGGGGVVVWVVVVVVVVVVVGVAVVVEVVGIEAERRSSPYSPDLHPRKQTRAQVTTTCARERWY